MVQHPYFGTLAATDVGWEGTVDLGGRSIPITLWIEDEATGAQLDVVATFALQLARFDERARAALADDAVDGESVRLYVDHHLAELSEIERQRVLGTAATISDEQFVARLVLRSVALHPEDEDQVASFDYTLAAEVTQYVLAVGFDADGEVISVEMES